MAWYYTVAVAVFFLLEGFAHEAPKNTLGIEFEQVTKTEYHLVEQPGDDFEPDDSAIATVDVRELFQNGVPGGNERRDAAVAALGRSLMTVGFAVLVGHGVDQSLLDDTPAAIRSFFGRLVFSPNGAPAYIFAAR